MHPSVAELVQVCIFAGSRISDSNVRYSRWSTRSMWMRCAGLSPGMMCLRSVTMITAMTVLDELTDLTRFDTLRQPLGFLGPARMKHLSGSHRHPRAISTTSNSHVRPVLVEVLVIKHHVPRHVAAKRRERHRQLFGIYHPIRHAPEGSLML